MHIKSTVLTTTLQFFIVKCTQWKQGLTSPLLYRNMPGHTRARVHTHTIYYIYRRIWFQLYFIICWLFATILNVCVSIFISKSIQIVLILDIYPYTYLIAWIVTCVYNEWHRVTSQAPYWGLHVTDSHGKNQVMSQFFNIIMQYIYIYIYHIFLLWELLK